MKDKCPKCGGVLNQYNPGPLCAPCQEKLAEERKTITEGLHYDVEDMRLILGLDSQEHVRRLARDGKLPRRIPGVRRWLWLKEVIDAWIRSDHQVSPVNTEEAQAILLGLQLGYPIDQATLYGHDPGNLVDMLKQHGYLQDSKDQSQ